jgi:hypothetical protein
MVRRVELDLPDFGYSSFQPKLAPEIYLNRLLCLRKKAGDYTHMGVYGDCEQS